MRLPLWWREFWYDAETRRLYRRRFGGKVAGLYDEALRQGLASGEDRRLVTRPRDAAEIERAAEIMAGIASEARQSGK